YAMLRVVPHKLSGVLVMFGAIAILFAVPWLDRAKVKSYRYRGLLSKVLLGLFAISFIWLGKIGAGPGTDPTETIIGRFLTAYYFLFFLTMPLWTVLDKTKPVPDRVTMHEQDLPRPRRRTGVRHAPVVQRVGRRRWLGPAPGRHRHQRPRLAAARRKAVHELLRRLPLAQVPALLAHGRGPGPDRGGGDDPPQLHRRRVRRPHRLDDARRQGQRMVRPGAARPHPDYPGARQRLGVHVSQVVLPGRDPPAGLEQHPVPERVDAQPAVEAAGPPARGIRRARRKRRGPGRAPGDLHARHPEPGRVRPDRARPHHVPRVRRRAGGAQAPGHRRVGRAVPGLPDAACL